MDWVGWFGLVVFCSLWIRASAIGMGRKFFSKLNETSPILMEMGYWDVVLCVWVVFAIFSILAISMARSKNTGKGKAPSSSMERVVKKRKSDTSQTIKKGSQPFSISPAPGPSLIRESEEIHLLRVRRHRRVKMRRSKPCLLRLLIRNRKSGPNRLQSGDFIASGV